MPRLCPACGNLAEELHQGLCFNCYKSLNAWLLRKCKDLNYTKIRTGLVLIIALNISEWLEEAKKNV